MILSDSRVLEEMGKGNIVILPFYEDCLGSNSYDIHLSKYIAIYEHETLSSIDNTKIFQKHSNGHSDIPELTLPLDAAKENKVVSYEIPPEGVVLNPGVLYLASTEEYTETFGCVPFLDGKSSSGRLGIFIHATAGRGDSGFKGHWTMEISVVEQVRVYAGMPIGQLIYFEVSGVIKNSYDKKTGAKYGNVDPRPMASRMFKNFPLKKPLTQDK